MARARMSGIDIREAGLPDVGALNRVAQAAKRHWNYPQAWMDLWKEDLTFTPDSLKQKKLFVLTLQGEIVGFYGLTHVECGLYELDDLWVQPEYMGQGLGRLLFQHALAQVNSSGGTTLRLEADPHAVGFYQKMGMRQVGEKPARPAGRFLPVMEMDLEKNLLMG